MKHLKFTPAARGDLSEIWDYSAKQWGSAQANKYILVIQNVCSALTDGFHVHQSANEIRSGYSKASAGSHVVFYQREAEAIKVIRILHRSMLPKKHFGDFD